MKKNIHRFAFLFFTETAINTYMVFFGNGLSAFFAFIFTVTLVREMNLADFGYFSAMLSFILLLSDLSDIGIGSSLSAFLPPLEAEKEKLLSFLKSAFFIQLLVSVSISLLLFIISPVLSGILFHTSSLSWMMKLASVAIFFMIMGNFFGYTLSARQKFIKVAFFSAYSSLLRIIILLVLIFLGIVSLVSVVWLQLLSLLLTAVTAMSLVTAEFLKVARTKGDIKKLISFAKYLGIARGLTALASRLDVLMLVALLNSQTGPVEAGIYSIASRVISIYPLLSGSFSQVIAPKLSKAQPKSQLNNFLFKVIFGTLGLIGTIIILIIIAEPFMLILFTQKAQGAILVFRLLLVSMIFFVASIPSVSLVIYHLRKPEILSINSILQLLIVFIGNLVFIPKLGRLGPAVSLILAYGITLITTSIWAYFSYLKRYEK